MARRGKSRPPAQFDAAVSGDQRGLAQILESSPAHFRSMLAVAVGFGLFWLAEYRITLASRNRSSA
jgi:hypothetical protein